MQNDRYAVTFWVVVVFAMCTVDVRCSSVDSNDSSQEEEPKLGRGRGQFRESNGDSLGREGGAVIGKKNLKMLKHLVKDAKSLARSSLGYWHAFVASISVIIVSELGDKTFFIAAILSMKHSRLVVFCGAMSALFLMTVLSSCFGWATQIVPRLYTFYFSTALFAFFGLKMLRDAYLMTDSNSAEEFEAAEEEVKKRDEISAQRNGIAKDLEVGAVDFAGPRTSVHMFRFISGVFVEAFTLTFLAEWGDRSQIATIILAARENVVGVTLGGTLGHSMCTGLAVLGGRMISRRISVRTVTIVGGIVFLCFAISAFFVNFDIR